MTETIASPMPSTAAAITGATTAPPPIPRARLPWDPVTIVHTAAATGVLGLGGIILLARKGTRQHRVLGRMWAAAMATTCLSSYGIRDDGGWTWIHGLSTYTLYCLGAGIRAIRVRKDVVRHRQFMRGSYIGAVITGALAVAIPGRRLHDELFLPRSPSVSSTSTTAVQSPNISTA